MIHSVRAHVSQFESIPVKQHSVPCQGAVAFVIHAAPLIVASDLEKEILLTWHWRWRLPQLYLSVHKSNAIGNYHNTDSERISYYDDNVFIWG